MNASMDEWLVSIKLDRYATEIKEEGYDELEFLCARRVGAAKRPQRFP
jgi:hypothetical protein